MPSLSAIRSENTSFSPTYQPTALFVGGTAGIGEGTANAFAHATNGNAHILICGRNQANAQRVISGFPKASQSKYEHVPCDATLMKNVVKASEDVKSKVKTLNFLVLSQGMLDMNSFTPTSEGIDRKLALLFYSRWKFVDELLPLLEEAAKHGQEARVLTVFASSTNTPIDKSDIGLKSNYTTTRMSKQTSIYNNLMVYEYAKRYPNISFTHIYPGWANTNVGKNLPWAVRALMSPMFLFAASIADCSEWMTHALLSPEYKIGAHYLDAKAEPYPRQNALVDEQDAEVLLEHFKSETMV